MRPPTRRLRCVSGFATQSLAHVLDSLVRVSRRDVRQHPVSISNRQEVRQVRTPWIAGHSKLSPTSKEPVPPLTPPRRRRLIPRWDGGCRLPGHCPPPQARGLRRSHLTRGLLQPPPPMLTRPPMECSPEDRLGPTRRRPRRTAHRAGSGSPPRMNHRRAGAAADRFPPGNFKHF